MNPAIADVIIARTAGESLLGESAHIDRADRAAKASRDAIVKRLGL